MRKLAAILFLTLLIVNLCGYRLWFYYVQQKADAQLIASLDSEQYNNQDLLELRVPLSLPYQTNWHSYERINGEIDINGKVYKYVKRKVANGELILYCLPDENRARIETARETFFKLANSLETDQSGKKQTPQTSALKNIWSDYEQLQPSWMLQPFASLPYPYALAADGHIPSALLKTPDQPPEVKHT